MDFRSNMTVSQILIPVFRCAIVFTSDLSFAWNPGGSEFGNAVATVPPFVKESDETPHNEEGVTICKVDEDDRQRISTKRGKCSHPSIPRVMSSDGQVAPTIANVSDSLSPTNSQGV